MPTLTFADALRYFFAPFLFYFYFAVYDIDCASRLQERLGVLGAISFLVAGSVFYFVYRYLIYEWVILWLYDIGRTRTYRRVFALQYQIANGRSWWPTHTIRAKRLFQIVVLNNMERFTSGSMSTKVAGVYMLHQAGLLAVPFLLVVVRDEDWPRAAFYFLCAAILLLTATVLDFTLEDEELCILRMMPAEVNKAAQAMQIARKA